MTALTDKKKNYLTEEQIDKQEHLSKERLEMLKPTYTWSTSLQNQDNPSINLERPRQNLIDLMHWVKKTFGIVLNNPTGGFGLNCWIHNKIVIDGAFLEFAEQKGVKIECLYRDSIASWKSDKNNEHFMAQGVFKISRGDLSFLHAALFHKGNQNEDEVSFFVIMADKDFEKYTALRNEFDDWLVARDREHLEIHVIGGEGQPYERDMSWDEVFLPTKLKKDIIDAVEGFLAAKELYEEKKIAWKRGILLWGDPGNGKTTTIRTIISRYDFKPVTVQTSPQTNDDTITQAFEYAQEQEPGLLYFEDLDSLLKMGTVSVSHFLNLLDGVSTKNGILVMATANDLRGLNEAIIDRPSRFDRKWEIPLPDEKMAKAYLQKWFGDALSAKSMNIIIKSAVDGRFSYAYLKELYITSAYHALAGGRKNPNLKDIQRAMEQMLTDKKNVEEGFQPEHHEEIGIR